MIETNMNAPSFVDDMNRGGSSIAVTTKSGLTSFLDEEDEINTENDLYLQAPDKFNPYQKHLLVSIKFWIGGK